MISQKSKISYCRDICIWAFSHPESVTKGPQLSCVPHHFCQKLAPIYILNFSCFLFHLTAHFADLQYAQYTKITIFPTFHYAAGSKSHPFRAESPHILHYLSAVSLKAYIRMSFHDSLSLRARQPFRP